MKYKIRLLMAFIIVSLTTYSAKKTPLINTLGQSTVKIEKENSDSIVAGTDEVEIDLNNNTMISKNGLNLKQGDLELKAFNLKRDVEKNKVFVNGELQTLFSNPAGNLSLQSLDGGEVTLDGKEGIFYNNFGYLEVGKITGAVKPNDKIYFGGEKIVYKDNVISIDDGWFTTDYNILKSRNHKNAGYYLLSKNVTIEPDKQVTFKGTNFYNGDKKRLPFSFPWFRANIRQNSKVPLFPQWGTDDYYGWNTSVGVLYGNRGDKFVGGFAPKFADRMGLLVGRWENWYKTDNFGTARLNIDDWLVRAKEKKKDNITDPGERISNQERSKRYKVNYTHEYNGDKGNLYFNVVNATYNMIPKLDDVIVNGVNNNKFKGENPDLTHSIGFYSLDTDLKNLGFNKDITLKSKLKLTSDKKVYGLMVYDDIDDIAYGSSVDNDLYAQVELYKDSKDYKIGGYYNYLYDMDPGSTFKDTQSRAEDFGFEFLDKDTKMGFSYDEKNGDKFRRLGLWERDPNNEPKVAFGAFGDQFTYNYTPTMVKEYDRLDTKDLRVSLGEYDFLDGYKIKPGYDYTSEIKKLNLDDDSARYSETNKSVLLPRSRQYNRFENIVFRDYKENKGYVEVFDRTTKFTIAGGTTEEEIWDRDGIYSQDGYQKYINNSDFYEVSAEKNQISLDRFGELALFGGVRYDRYKKGFNPITQTYSTGHDSSIRSQFRLNHTIELFNNENNPNRAFDFAMANDLKFFYQRYDYDSGNINFGDTTVGNRKLSSKDIRMNNKENIYQVIDSVSTTIGNTDTIYTIEYKRGENPATKDVTNEILKNKIDFRIDGDQSLIFNIGEDKKYTNKTKSGENYNNYTFGEYGVAYYFGPHKLSYQNNKIDSKIWDIDTNLFGNRNLTGDELDNAKEKIRLNTYAYEYEFDDNKFGIDYSEGTDRRVRYPKKSAQVEELNVKNRIYGVSFLDGGEEREHHYRGTFETYRNSNSTNAVIGNTTYNLNNSDVVSFNYEFKDKSFSEEELKKYAELEYNKDSTSLTPQEIYRVRDMLRNREREHVDFRLNDNIYSQFDNMGDYKHNFRFNIMMEKNQARYKITNDYWKSLEKIQLGLFYSQNRFGVGYYVEENAEWNNKVWNKTDREHKVSLMARIGKPSEGWTLKTYAKFYENLKDPQNRNRGKGALDGLGVEIGKEMGYYQWAVAFEKEYVLSAKDYQWKAALQFTLLTFPENPLFGIGADTGADKKTTPQTYLFDGLKVDDVID